MTDDDGVELANLAASRLQEIERLHAKIARLRALNEDLAAAVEWYGTGDPEAREAIHEHALALAHARADRSDRS